MKKQTTTPFAVPTLASADAEYADLNAKFEELSAEHASKARELRELEADIRARPTPRLRPGVAELLGETVDAALFSRPQLAAELRQRVADLEAAVEIVRRRISERRGPASSAACRLARGEYRRRLNAFAEALLAAQAAFADADALVDELERADVQVTYLPPVRHGFFRGDDNACNRLLREIAEAGR